MAFIFSLRRKSPDVSFPVTMEQGFSGEVVVAGQGRDYTANMHGMIEVAE